MSWRDQQSSRAYKVGEYSEGDDLEGGVVGYPRVVQVARSCYHKMGVSYRGRERFFEFLGSS
jgi:hypothetical protein